MGRRTINAYKLTFNKMRKSDDVLSPADLNGTSLIDIVESWAKNQEERGLFEFRDDIHGAIREVKRFNNNILIVKAESGKSGEQGTLYDVNGNSADIPINEKQVATSFCRAVLFCPTRGQMSLWFSEYSGRSSSAKNVLDLLEKQWRQISAGVKFTKSRVRLSEYFLENADVREIEVRLNRRSSDLADSVKSIPGTLSHSLRPERGHRFPGGLLRRLQNKPSLAFDYLEIPEKSDSYEVFAEVKLGGRTRKIKVANPEQSFYYYEELNGSNDPVLTDNELIHHCIEEVTEYFERSNLCWEPEWSKEAR